MRSCRRCSRHCCRPRRRSEGSPSEGETAVGRRATPTPYGRRAGGRPWVQYAILMDILKGTHGGDAKPRTPPPACSVSPLLIVCGGILDEREVAQHLLQSD